MSKLYLANKNVYEAALERMDFVFDNFKNIFVSISGGKDSTVLFDIAQKEAVKRGRTINAYFLDQEAEYGATIELIREMMNRENVIPYWFQVPMYMTNATSYEQDLLYAWGPGEDWMREKEPLAIKDNPSNTTRFYPFIDWFSNQFGRDTCFLVGLRSEESLNRYRAVTSNPGVEGIDWSSNKKGAVSVYPLYDWTFEDIWTYIGKTGCKYNRIYDYMYSKGVNISTFRVSNLIHEKSYKCLTTLQEFEPDTYESLVKRLKGITIAALYGKEMMVYNAKKKPAKFATWMDYRDFLLDTLPTGGRELFDKRFGRQGGTESVYRQQVQQLLVNDWENNLPVTNQEKENPLKKWMDIL